jgi:hypothetical protein
MPYPKAPREIVSVNEWDKYIAHVINHFQKIDRKSNERILEHFDLTPTLTLRRKTAILNTLDMVQKQFDEPDIHCWDPTYTGNRWVSLCLQAPTYENLEKEQHLLTGAAIWILEQVANDPDSRKALFNLLPSDERKLINLYEFSYWHPRYDFDLIQSVVYVLRYRNASDSENEYETLPRALTDDISAMRGMNRAGGRRKKSGKQGQKGASAQSTARLQHSTADDSSSLQSQNRENYEKLLKLIPKESIEAASQRLKDMFWPWVADYYRTIHPYALQLKETDEQILRAIEEHNHIVDLLKEEYDALINLMRGKPSGGVQNSRMGRTSGSNSATTLRGFTGAQDFAFLPSPDELLQQVYPIPSLSGEIGNALQQNPVDIHLDQIREYYNRLDAAVERYNTLIKEYDAIRNREYQQISDFITTGGQGKTDEDSPADKSANAKSHCRQIQNPYELCFALLYLIETGDDVVWTYGPCIGLMYAVCDNLPWGLREYEMSEDPIWEDFTIHEFPAQKPANLPDWNERRFQVKENTPRSLAQLLYECTGCLMPADMHLYDGFMKALRKCGVRAKETPALLTAMTTLGVSQMQIPAYNLDNWDEAKRDAADGADKSADSSDLHEDKERLTLELKQLRSALHDAERRERDARKELEKNREIADREHRELADLREYVFNQESEDWETDSQHGNQQNAVALPYEVQRTTLVFGGHESWLAPIRQMLKGNIRFIDRGYTFDTAIIRGADLLWIQPNAIPHKMYYRIIDQARRLKKPVRYFTNASAALCAQQVAEGDQKPI